MKALLCLVSLICASAALARDTAYQALRTIGTERGQAVLNQVITVQGRGGAPQPGSWKIVLDDASARGGVREIEVAKGKVVSERTPVGAYSGATGVMDFQKLNLDSEGAFAIAQKEASKSHLGFDSIDYTLRSGEAGKPPVWVLRLVDANHKTTGTIHIAADTGAIVRSDLYGRQSDRVFVQDQPAERTRADDDRVTVRDVDHDPADDEVEYVDDGHGGRLRVGHRINKALHEAGATLEQFITGKRTIDRKYRDEDR